MTVVVVGRAKREIEKVVVVRRGFEHLGGSEIEKRKSEVWLLLIFFYGGFFFFVLFSCVKRTKLFLSLHHGF